MMSYVNNTSIVNQQYKDDKNLSIRISLHQKYSTNKYGYTNWLFDIFEFSEGCRILELGCGNGDMWDIRIQKLPIGSHLILSDLSSGMVETVSNKFRNCPDVSAEILDIQDIRYPDNSFDIVIANNMLYHVPDLHKAISEVYRVLKPGGCFYAATLGNNGMNKYLCERFKEFNPMINAFDEPFSFNLQNGKDLLGIFFTNIKLYEYQDSLEITETSDLINWILSTTLMSRIDRSELDGLEEFFDRCKGSRGIIKIPKQNGMFAAVK